MADQTKTLDELLDQLSFHSTYVYVSDEVLAKDRVAIHAHVRAQVLAERESCAEMADDFDDGNDLAWRVSIAIRARSTPQPTEGAGKP